MLVSFLSHRSEFQLRNQSSDDLRRMVRMTSFQDERLSNMLRLVGAGSKPSPPVVADMKTYATITMLEELRANLEENFRRQVRLEMKEQLSRVDEKSNVILAKVPVMESRIDEVARIGRELSKEREDQKRFREGIGKLMWEMKQLTLKVKLLEGRIDEIERGHHSHTPLSTESTPILVPMQSNSSDRSSEIDVGETKLEISMNENVNTQDLNYGVVLPIDIDASRAQHEATLDEEGGIETAVESAPVLSRTGCKVKVPAPAKVMMTRSRMKMGSSSSETALLDNLDSTGGVLNGTSTTGKGDSHANPESSPTSIMSTGAIHEKSSMAGRFLAFLCLCGLEFDSDISISEHVRGEKTTTGNQGTSSPASAFPKDNATFSNAIAHVEDPSRPLHCTCGIECRDGAALFQHLKYYTNRKLFPCKPCGKQFRFALELKAHLRRVHKTNLSSSGRQISVAPNYSTYKKGRANRYKCQVCAISFTNAKKLADHRKAVHIGTGSSTTVTGIGT